VRSRQQSRQQDRHELTDEDRRRGGNARASMPSWEEDRHRLTPDERRRGMAELERRHGTLALLRKVQAWHLAHPTDLERFVISVFVEELGLVEGGDYTREVIVELTLPGNRLRHALLDFLVLGFLVIEPGAWCWHGSSEQSIDGQDRRPRDTERRAALQAIGFEVLVLSDHQIKQEPGAARELIAEALAQARTSQAATTVRFSGIAAALTESAA